MKMKSLARAAGLCVLLATGASASAAVLYGTTGNGSTLSNLYTIDTTTGVSTLIGAVGYTINGLDWYNGTLYGTTSANGAFRGLVQIDTTTGAGTQVGTGWGLTNGTNIAELAIDSNGNAYGWGEPGEDDLYAINLANGTTVRVGESNLGTAVLGLTFSLSDTLYLLNCNNCGNATIDTTTGASTSIGTGAFYAHHADTNPDTGQAWGLDSFPGSAGGSTGINFVDLASNTVTGTLGLDRGFHTLAFVSGANPVPEPAPLALLGLAIAGLALRRRRSRV